MEPSPAPASPSPPEETGYQLKIGPGQTVKQSLLARPSLYQFAVQTSWSDGDVQLSLTSPSGRVYDRSTTDPGVSHHTGGMTETYSLARSLTEPGKWTVELFGASVPNSGEIVQIGVYQLALSDLSPVPLATSVPDRGVAPVTVQFSSLGSDPLGGATLTGYRWDFGDCSPAGDGPGPVHVYRFPGKYTVVLTVTDSNGQSASVQTQVFVTATDQPPTAAFFWASIDTSNPDRVFFDGGQSSDVDGQIARYSWDFGDGAVGTGIGPEHTYAKSGTYQVRLTVTDDGGLSASTCQLVTTGKDASTATPCSA